MINENYKVLLASESPRRRQLLKLLYADFKTAAADIDETIPDGIDVYDVAETLAVKKAMSFKNVDCFVIGCDTVVICDGQIIGKPKNTEDAIRILKMLSGRIHEVVTGVCITYKSKTFSFSEKTQVEFYPLSDDEISAYIMTGEPFDKAGAYGIQGLGSLFVRKINGDFYNVVGLPVSRLRHEINRFLRLFD